MNDPEHKLGAPTGPSATNGASLSADSAASDPSRSRVDPDDMHDLFAAPANFDSTDDDDPLAQLRNDPNYSALIRDLEYIAREARALFQPADETPSDDLWNKIQSQLPPKPDAD